MILTELFGNESAAKVLLYIENFGSGYPLGIARTFDVPVSQIQRQLERLEDEGLVLSKIAGKRRTYTWNPRCFYLKDLRSLLKKGLAEVSGADKKKYFKK